MLTGSRKSPIDRGWLAFRSGGIANALEGPESLLPEVASDLGLEATT